MTVTLYVHLFATPLLLIAGYGELGSLVRVPPQGVLIVFFLAVVSSIAPMFLALVGITFIGARKVSIVSTLELPAAGLMAFLILREPVYAVQILGAGLLFAGILALLWSSLSEQDGEADPTRL